MKLPEVAALTWKIEIHTSAGVDYEYVVPERRRRQQVNAAGADIGTNDFLSFREGQAYGSYPLVNLINFCNIGNKLLDTLDKRWPTRVTPNRDAFQKFLSMRSVSEARTLNMPLGDPQEFADGWVKYAWKAFDETTLDKITKEGFWKGSNSDNQVAWPGHQARMSLQNHGRWQPL